MDDNWVIKVSYQIFKIQYQALINLINYQKIKNQLIGYK
jgi:hypothetical protein